MSVKAIRPEHASPVTALEFYNALSQLWRGSRRYPRRGPRPGKLGLAVSGGGDSMALAYLCTQVASEKLIPGLSFQAFVVDHQARKESTEEAIKVSGWLRDLGLLSKILTLQWPKGSIPSQLPDFETQARRLRYQSLGTACRDNSIPALLLGHHLDDNIETVIMRLSQGQHGTGLKGVPNIGLIPECHGIYGVSGSGGILNLADIRSGSTQGDDVGEAEPGSNFSRPIIPVCGEQLPISDGSISILRPFSTFSKERLLATCADKGVPFVNDPTNFDFALTPRNTVRYLLSSDRLPQTLQSRSILKIIEDSKAMDEYLTAASNSILRESRIICFDRRSGKLLIRLPLSPEVCIGAPETQANLEKVFADKEKSYALSIRRILDIVSPCEDNALRLEFCQQLQGRVFANNDGADNITPMNKFTLGGVQFQQTELNKQSSQSKTWLLTREPFRSAQAKPVTTISLHREPSLGDRDSTTTLPWSDWHLWDNRYWIRVQTNIQGETATEPANITIRPLEEPDLTSIRHQPTLLKQVTQNHNYIPIYPKIFNRLLSDCAPGRVRFTLPVIAEAAGERRVLALPTLGIIRTDSGEDSLYRLPRIKWEIMYKRVDPEVLELTQAVI